MLAMNQKGQQTMIVTQKETAQQVESGELAVFATPSLLALVEKTAWQSIASCLSAEQTTVGTNIVLDHLSPTPVGLPVTCHTNLTIIDRKRLVFSFEVYDEVNLIAKGTHERFIVNRMQFSEKAQQKLHQK